MITAALLALVLQSSADDCAVLEALLPEPVAANPVRTERPEENMVECTGLGRIVLLDRNTSIYADWPEMGEGRTISGERYDEVMHWYDEIYPALPNSGRRELARVKFDLIHDGLVRSWGELPPGLAASFIEAAVAQRVWDCAPEGWTYLPEDSDPQSVLADLHVGTGISAHGLDRPGYSSDGQWALVRYSQQLIPPRLDGPDLPTLRASGGEGYILMRRSDDGWVELDRYSVIRFN